MYKQDSENTTFSILQQVRIATKRNAPFSDKIQDVETELRLRRRQFLGSYLPVRQLVFSCAESEDAAIEALCAYLTSRTMPFWSSTGQTAAEYCYAFYKLVICALTGGRVRDECVDDILRLSEVLTENPAVFTIAVKNMLMPDTVGELFNFVDNQEYQSLDITQFPHAVLGGICVLLGVLPDPCRSPAEENEKEL